jgi:hypothetical protein
MNAAEPAPHSPWVIFALFTIVVIGGTSRLASSATIPLIFDEYHWLAVADRISLVPPVLPLHGDAHPPGSAYLIALGSRLLGPNLIGYRLASVIAGTALIWIVWKLASREAGPHAGLAAAALVATNQYLFGISRLATEKSFELAFAAGALLAFQIALERDRKRDYALSAVLFGLGLLTKQTLVLWLPVLVWEIVSRRSWRSLLEPGPLLAAAIVLLAVLPDLIWNLFLKGPTLTLSDRGIVDQLQRIGFGLNLGPTSLFVRRTLLEAAGYSEYPAMMVWVGAPLLLGALAGAALFRTSTTRLWLRLGWVPFLFFTVFGNPRDGALEFWWSALSVVPFLLLTVALVARAIPLALPVPVLLSLAGILTLFRTGENCHAPTVWTGLRALSREAESRCVEEQHALIARFPARDPVELTRFGDWRLPAARPLHSAAADYLDRLGSPNPPPSPWWPYVSPGTRPREVVRMQYVTKALGGQ